MDALAQQWFANHPHTAEQLARLTDYVRLLMDESVRQNLIARSTLPTVWSRHIVDSAQLGRFIKTGPVADLGSGAGLPGIVLGILGHWVTLVEPRRQRADFLRRCVDELDLVGCTVAEARMEQVTGSFATIVARAVAPMAELFDKAGPLSSRTTRWILPRGAGGHEERDRLSGWTATFHVEQSVTNEASVIIIADGVRRDR